MNIYICLGKVVDVKDDEKYLKFTLSVWQKKTCCVPCVVFNPTQDGKDYICSLQSTGVIVSVQGWLTNYEVRIHGVKVVIIELATTLFNIKEV